jgi:hypothetical protein
LLDDLGTLMMSLCILLGVKNVSDKNSSDNQNTSFMFNYIFENCAAYEIMWKNVVMLNITQVTNNTGQKKFKDIDTYTE